MPLSNELVSDFVKLVKNNEKKASEETLYGTAVQYNDQIYVRLDGSDRITPVNTTTNVRVGDRVMVLLKNHTATVTGNLTSPSASNNDVKEVDKKIDEIADEVTTLLYIASSQGNVFKNTNVSTVFSITIFRGTQRITDSQTMKAEFGDGAYLQWKYQTKDSDEYLMVPPEDERILEDGFKFKVSPNDIDTKGIYTCDLIVE